MIGKTLAHYEISALLGEGGMGQVYRAHDTKLSRDVALKVLPEAFARDSQRMGRFAREAQMLASLNHPHIATIYGLEEDGEDRALVMELVEGETLQERIDRDRIPFDEVARIGLQLAAAIEFAHEKGIVHRDLKPANIMLDAERQVKVLDFGLAKALEEDRATEDLANSPTLSIAATQAGVILGTAAYMSPEQASGTNIDRRSDVWSYGVVLFEMLSGRKQFSGETISHTMASVLKDDPEWASLPSNTPPRIVELLRRCLEKHPKRRLQAIGEARVLWEAYFEDPQSFEEPASLTTAPHKQRTGLARALPWSIAAVAFAALIFSYFQGASTPPESATPLRLSIPISGATSFANNQVSPPVISPDGSFVTYTMMEDSGVERLWIRPLDSFEARPLAGTAGAQFAFWSPDSRHLGFFAEGRLRRIEISSGLIQSIGDVGAFYARGGSWTSKDQILFAPNSNTGIWVVDASGGVPRQVTKPDSNVADLSHRWPYVLPDGDHFLFLTFSNNDGVLAEHGGIYIGSINGNSEPRRLMTEASSVNYTASGHILVMQESNLVAIPFDPLEQQVTGDRFVIADDVLLNGNNGYATFSASSEGTLVFARGTGSVPSSSFRWADRAGALTKTPVHDAPMYDTLRLSPNAERAATTSPGPNGTPEIYLLDLLRGVRSRLGSQVAYTVDSPIWSPAGDRILYVSARDGTWNLYARSADGSGAEELVVGGDLDKEAVDWVGDRILYWMENPAHAGALYAIYEISTGTSTTIFEENGYDLHPRISPDGNYISYDSAHSGRHEIDILHIDSGARWQASTDGGRDAHWRDDGREIVFVDPQRRIMSISVNTDEGDLQLGQPVELFQVVQNVTAWEPQGDHSRFLLALRPEAASEPVHVILNWDSSAR